MTTVWEVSDTARITEEHQRRIAQLIEREVEQAVNEARNAAREEAKREAVGIIAEAKRRAEDIVREAKQQAEKVIGEAKNRVQTMLDEVSQRRAMSEPPPSGVPPPFVSTEANRINPRRTPIFWA